MKTLLLLLLLCAPSLPGPARAAVPTNPVRGIEAVEPIRERATASNLVHFDYRLDACGGLRHPNRWLSWQITMGTYVSEGPYYVYFNFDGPCILLNLPNPNYHFQMEWLQFLSENVAYSAILPGNTRLRSHPLPTSR